MASEGGGGIDGITLAGLLVYRKGYWTRPCKWGGLPGVMSREGTVGYAFQLRNSCW